MANPQTMYVRHVHTGEIKQVTEEQRAVQDRTYWVPVTGNVQATAPDTTDGEPSATGDEPDPADAPVSAKTVPKARAPKE